MEHQVVDAEREEGGGALSLERAFLAVRKRWKLVVALPLVAAATVAALVAVMPNRYDASAIVQIDPRQKSITNIDPVVPDLNGDQASIESEVEIIKSRPIVLRVIDTLDLRDDPEFRAPTLIDRLKGWAGMPSKPESDLDVGRAAPTPPDGIGDLINPGEPGKSRPERDEIAVAFLDRLKVTRVRNTLLIDIRFSASDAVKAARIANTIAEVYLADQLESKSRANATAGAMLERKIEEMRNKVAEAEHKVEQWKAAHGVFDTQGQVLSELQLTRLMEQAVIARNATTEAKSRYEQAQKLARMGDRGTALEAVLKSEMIRLLKEQLSNSTRKAAELGTKYGPRHPDIQKVRAEIAQTSAQIDAEIERQIANLKNEAETAERREHELADSLADLKRGQVEIKGAGVALKDLEREATTTKQLFEALLTRYKQTTETQNFQLPDARIIEKADAPLFPASPRRKQLVLIGTGGGFVLSIALCLLLELMAPGIGRPEDVERALDVAHISSTPAVLDDGMQEMHLTKAVRLIVAEPSGGYADAIRSARRELDARRKSRAPRIILVASSLPGEGAEIFASNLAHHYAMTGGRPLLVDGDMRLQTLTRQLAPQRQIGLLDQIVNRRPVEAAILRDGVTGLHFLPSAGPLPPKLSVPEVLSSDDAADALYALKQRFDTIIVSAPPLLPVLDTRILADYCDQIVFAMAWQKTPKQIAKRALKLLGINEQKVTGAVLTGVAEEALEPMGGISMLLARADDSYARSRPAA